MKPRAVFLDRDGTLTRDAGYTHRLADFKLLPGVIEGLKRLEDYLLFIVTNQSGIGRGFFSAAAMHRFHGHLLKNLVAEGIAIQRVYFCPHTPDDGCNCRKPLSLMIETACRDFGIDRQKSFVVGDTDSDMALARNTGCRGILVLTGQGPLKLRQALKQTPAYVAADLVQATTFILGLPRDKIIDRSAVARMARRLKALGRQIVTVNGTFDIPHRGHQAILDAAKSQGDVLMVGVNSDASVRKNKGPRRPVNTQLNRAAMMACNPLVDFVFVFDEPTPLAFLEDIRPQVHVNGSEYGEDCIEAETVKKHGGRLHIVDLLDGYSTTRLLTPRHLDPEPEPDTRGKK